MRGIIFFFLFLCSFTILAQENDEVFYKNKTREIGLNSTLLIKNFISVGNVNRTQVVRGIFYKKINQNRNGFRAAFGATSELVNSTNVNFFFLSMGYERRTKSFNNVQPYWGFDVFLNLNNRNLQFESVIQRGFGFGPVFGLNYNFSDRLSMGAESAIYATIDDFSLDLDFVPPIDLFFYVKFPKKVVSRRNIRYF